MHESREFGAYGGRYVPETLIPALDELESAWAGAARRRGVPGRAARAAHELCRASHAAHAGRAVRAGPAHLPQARGPDAHRVAQAEQCARAGSDRATARQAPDHRGDRRRPARRCDGHRVCAVRARVHRLHGQRGHPPSGAQRRAHEPARRRGAPGRVRHANPQRSDERGDPRLDRERRDDVLPDRLVRRPGAVSRDRPRAPARDRTRGARAVPRAPKHVCRKLSLPASGAARTRSGCSTTSSPTPTCA